jgi:hypothetical protein
MKTLVLAPALLLAAAFGSSAAESKEIELTQLVSQYLPGCSFQPAPPAKPLAIFAPAGDGVVLATAARENGENKKGLGYWVTPTMAFLGRQGIAVATTDDATGVIKLLHVIWRGPEFVKQKIYNAVAVEGGWVVKVGRLETNPATQSRSVVQAMQPYELLTDASGRVTEIRERAYPYTGPAAHYGNILRSVYAREMQHDNGAHFATEVGKELAKAEKTEKAAKSAQKK